MSRSEYINKLTKFQHKYFPQTPTIENSPIEKTGVFLVNENNILLEIISRYENESMNSVELSLIRNLQHLYDQYLFAILTKNKYELALLTRVNADLFLKLFYALNVSNPDKSILNEKFRFLKDKLSQLDTSTEQTQMVKIIEDYFSTYSEIIHVKDGKTIETFAYLADELNTSSIVTLKIQKTLQNFNKAICILLFKSINLNFSRLGTIERKMLTENFKEKKIARIKKWIAE